MKKLFERFYDFFSQFLFGGKMCLTINSGNKYEIILLINFRKHGTLLHKK